MIYWLIAQVPIKTDALPKVNVGDNSLVKTVLNILFSILGAISLLFVTYGGFKYVISRGEPQSVAKAKDTILYAVIGLVIALLATVIVNFVIGKL